MRRPITVITLLSGWVADYRQIPVHGCGFHRGTDIVASERTGHRSMVTRTNDDAEIEER